MAVVLQRWGRRQVAPEKAAPTPASEARAAAAPIAAGPEGHHLGAPGFRVRFRVSGRGGRMKAIFSSFLEEFLQPRMYS